MRTELKMIQIGGGSYGVIIPKLLREHIQVKEGDIIEIQDDSGKHGNFLSLWKKGE